MNDTPKKTWKSRFGITKRKAIRLVRNVDTAMAASRALIDEGVTPTDAKRIKDILTTNRQDPLRR
jgi:hypothetical protein